MDLESMINAWVVANAYAVEHDDPGSWALVDDWGDLINQKLVAMEKEKEK